MLDPLAFRVRPKNLDDVIGQKHLVGPNGFLRKSVEKKQPCSMILYGPPGTGKTTIAEAYSESIGIHYVSLNAVTTDKKEMQEAINDCRLYEHSIIIIDEVHRLDKAKQDLLLPYVENGTFFLLGATTANPYIAINRAIRSRCAIFEVKPLSQEDIAEGLKRVSSSPNGLNNEYSFTEEGYKYIARLSGGDLRFALNLMEECTIKFDKGIEIGEKEISSIESVPNIASDKNEDEHYDAVSAMQKSIRGSDVDAALYYVARLALANDLDSIKRRLLVTAYEDIGLASPSAVQRCQMALEVAEMVGFPEAIIPIAFTVTELCLSPKSKASCEAGHAAMDYVSNHPSYVQDYLRLTPVNMKEEDKYPYDRPDLWEKIQYLPDVIKDLSFYTPNEVSRSTYEKALNENYLRMKKQGRSSSLRELKKKK